MYAGLTLRAAIKAVVADLAEGGTDTPDIDAKILLSHATGLSREAMIMEDNRALTAQESTVLGGLVNRRLDREPIDHILGVAEFYGLMFKVTKDVLSPRPETEHAVELVLGLLEGRHAPHILDLGTGSGAIAVSIATNHQTASILATDQSEAALKVARINAEVNGVGSRIEFSRSDWFENIEGSFDVVVSNPPYIDGQAMQELSREVANFDPHEALFGGEDGLDAYRVIIGGARTYLKSDGYIVLEIGYDQKMSVSELLEQEQFRDISVLQDYGGHDRIISARHP